MNRVILIMWRLTGSFVYLGPIGLGNGPYVLGNGPQMLGNGPHMFDNGSLVLGNGLTVIKAFSCVALLPVICNTWYHYQY